MNELQRAMLQNQQMGGITSGLEDESMQSAEALGGIASGIETLFQNIDKAENPKEIMDAIRGDEASVEERRNELGQLVGKADADKTPESVLTMVQPLMTVIESTGGIASLDTEETPVAPNVSEAKQMEAMTRMQSGEAPVMLRTGSVNAVNANPTGNPASNANLLALALQKGGMFGQLDPIKGIEIAKRLTPMPKRSDYTGLFSDRPSAYKDYAETLPGLTLAKFGQIVGRSPTLIDAVLDPQTAQLADPIMKLSLLQAQEKQKALDKEATAFTEAKKEAQKSRSEMIKPLITQIGTPNTEIFKADDGTTFLVNKKTGASSSLAPGAPKVQFFQGLGLATIQPDGKTTFQKADLQIVEDKNTGRKVAFNPLTKTIGQEIIPGRVKLETFGSDQFGYYTRDPFNNTIMQLVEGKIPLSDSQKLIRDFTKNRAVLADAKSSTEAKLTAQTNLEALRPKIFGQDTEFIKVVNEMTDNFRKSISEDDLDGMEQADVEQSVRDYRQELFSKYFDAKTISQSRYDPRSDEKKTFLDILKKKIERRDEGLENVTKMGELASESGKLAQNFKTGLFAPQRLFLGKLLDAFPPMKAYMEQNTDPDMYKEFFGGGIASGEALKSVSTQFALAFAQFLPGNLNTEEINMIQTAAPGLTNTKEGIELLTKMFTRQSARLQKEKDYSTKVLAETDLQGKDLYVHHEKMMREFRRKNQILSKEEANIVKEAGQNIQPNEFFQFKGGNKAGLPATPTNKAIANISKSVIDATPSGKDPFKNFLAQAVPRIKDVLAKNFQERFGQPGDVDAYLDPNTPEGMSILQQMFRMGGLDLIVKDN